MSITYTWEITSLKKLDTLDSLKNVIYEVSWKKIGTDTESNLQGSFESSTKFPVENINPNNFISFENLTKQDIINWLETVVTGGYELEVNNRIKQEIDKQRSTVTVLAPNEFPWQN